VTNTVAKCYLFVKLYIISPSIIPHKRSNTVTACDVQLVHHFVIRLSTDVNHLYHEWAFSGCCSQMRCNTSRIYSFSVRCHYSANKYHQSATAVPTTICNDDYTLLT